MTVVIVDTSIWADHFHRPIQALSDLLARDAVAQHPFVTGELALGNPSNRAALIAFLSSLGRAIICNEDVLLDLVADRHLGGSGIGFVDAHLLASAVEMNCALWTSDKRLLRQAERLDLTYSPK